MNRFYISTPIYYVNARPHLGHAYTTLVADSMTRFHKIMGCETYFLTGTDEHGDKIVKAAQKNNCEPAAYVDQISGEFQQLWKELKIGNNDFIRTTQERHKKIVQEFLQRVYDAGDIYFGEYGGHYCYGCERFYTEKELEDGLCPQHKEKPEYISEKNYFFRMSKHQDWLKRHILDNPDFIRPERYRNEVLSLLESGALEDLCISRPKSRLTWGIELPFDTEYVCYVWFDALLNYITALQWPDGELFHKFWPSVQHLVAKDILKPHAIFWPTMLHAAGLPVYQHLNVHGYWLVKETKMSKSLGNVVDPLSMARGYGLSAFRYFLLREMHFGNDANFSEEALVGRLNADLANDLGNGFNRVLAMTHKYMGGRVPEPTAAGPAEEELRDLALNACRNFQQLFEQVQFSRALDALWELVRGLNKYIDTAQPWALQKAGDPRLGAVLYSLLEALRKVALHLWPVMPEASEAMLEQLGVPLDVKRDQLPAEAETWGLLKPGLELAKTSNLFPRVELEAKEEPAQTPTQEPKAAKAKPAPVAPAAVEAAPTIQFEDFQKLDLRVGVVLSAAKHPKADKLLLLKIDLGEAEPRQIVAGLAEHFAPEELEKRQVVVVCNLEPRKLRGEVSQGMVLAVRQESGMKLLTASGAVAPGSKVS